MGKRNKWEREGESDGWYKPRRTFQRTLFPEDRDTFLASVQLSLDELERWRERGWLSFDASKMAQLNTPETTEILFLRNVARSGLSDAIINRMLARLSKPYSYDPLETAYSFVYGWVALPPFNEEDVDSFMADYFEQWAKAKLESGDTQLLDKMVSVVMSYRIRKARSEVIE